MMQRNDIRARSMERALKRHPREEGNLEEKKQRPSSEPSFGAAKNFCVGGGSGKIYHIILYHRTLNRYRKYRYGNMYFDKQRAPELFYKRYIRSKDSLHIDYFVIHLMARAASFCW